MPRLASSVTRRRAFLASAAAAALAASALPAAAGAVTLTTEGDTIVLRADPGVDDLLILNSDGDGTTVFSAGSYRIDTPQCSSRFGGRAQCSPLPGGVRVELGDGDDHLEVAYDFSPSTALVADGGPGNDALESEVADRVDALSGGDGDDRLLGGPGDDVLDGGAGDDTVSGGDGRDAVLGGADDDTLRGDDLVAAADVIDGGPGIDQLDPAAYTDRGTPTGLLEISLDGKANDGEPGEGDDVTGVEVMRLSLAARLVAGADQIAFQVYETNPLGSTMVGSPGADHLEGYDFADVIDGRGGADEIEGGYGNDRLTGGPGRDVIVGDEVDPCNLTVCRPAVGNDVIDAADGEADSIDCGVGRDRLRADRADTINACEKVTYAQAGKRPKKGRRG